MTHEAYILVKDVGLTYSEVKTMARLERQEFLKLYIKEMEHMHDANKRLQSNRQTQ